MPKLPTFTAPLGGDPTIGSRRATALDFSPTAGISAGSIARAGRKLHDDFAASESREGLVLTSEIRTKFAKRLDDAVTSGEDLEAIKQEMNDELSAVGDDFVTREGQDNISVLSSRTNAMFDSQANTISVQRAGLEAKRQATSLMNDATKTLAINPFYLKIAIQDVNDFVETLKNISPEQRATIKQGLIGELNVAAAMSSARITPRDTKARLDAGTDEWELTSAQRIHIRGVADSTLRTIRADEALQRQLRKEKRVLNNEDAFDEAVKVIFGSDDIVADISGFMEDFLKNPDFLAPTREHVILLMNKRVKELQTKTYHTHPPTYARLRERIDLPQGHPNRITDKETVWFEYGKLNGLSREDSQGLEKRIEDNKSSSGRTFSQTQSAFLKNIKSILDKSTIVKMDGEGGLRYHAFTVFVDDRADVFRAAGKDPYLLFRPASPDYVGLDLPRFMTPGQELQQNIADALQEALAATLGHQKARAKKDKEEKKKHSKAPTAGDPEPIEETVIPTVPEKRPLDHFFGQGKP